MLFSASAPGSLFLFGEYAVLHGKRAILAAIDKTITVTIFPRQDQRICIDSDLGHYETLLNNISITPPFEYVLAALAAQKKLTTGLTIRIRSEFPIGIGLGSSGAVTVALLATLLMYLEGQLPNPADLWHQAKHIMQQVQGKGSGADLAASIYGNVISFENNPMNIEVIAKSLPIHVVYSGDKLKTAAAISLMNEHREKLPEYFLHLDNMIHELSLAAIAAIQYGDLTLLGGLLNIGHEILISLGVSTPLINELVTELNNQPQIFGAKISGAGLGDCVIALGQIEGLLFPTNDAQQLAGVRSIPLGIASQGLRVHHE